MYINEEIIIYGLIKCVGNVCVCAGAMAVASRLGCVVRTAKLPDKCYFIDFKQLLYVYK